MGEHLPERRQAVLELAVGSEFFDGEKNLTAAGGGSEQLWLQGDGVVRGERRETLT